MRPLDAATLVAWLAAVTLWGAWLGRGQRTGRDYFLGGRDLPWPAVALSIVATETSTLTFLSVPGIAYAGTLAFLQLAFGYLLGRCVVAAVLLPAYWRGELSTAYELLETRFGRPTRRFASVIFMVTRLLGDGVRLFATAVPLAFLTGWPFGAAVAAVGALTAVYTLFGGIRAVVWTDSVQLALYVAGALAAAAVLQTLLPGGWPAALADAGAAGKLVLIDPRLDFAVPYTIWAGIFGGAFLSMASHGADQLIVQRVLACRDLAGARRAMVASGFGVILQFALFLVIGIGLWSLYGEGAFERTDEAFAFFVVEALPAGVTGLVVAAVFAAAMSTLSSSINALASATAYDFWAPAVGTRDDERILRAGRVFSGIWTVALVAAALAFVPLSRGTAAVEVALSAASLVYGGLLGAFALALFVPRARQADAIPAMAAGVAAVAAAWIFGRSALAWPWYVPLGAAVTTATGWALSLRRSPGTRTPG